MKSAGRRWVLLICLLMASALWLWAVVGSKIDFTLGTTPGNPTSGKIRLWSNSGTGSLECLTSGGGSCLPVFVGSGQAVLSAVNLGSSGVVAANSCATNVITVSVPNAATTDSIVWTPTADISGITGYGIASTDGLKIYPYPTSGNANFRVCNGTGSSITVGGTVTLNFVVVH